MDPFGGAPRGQLQGFRPLHEIRESRRSVLGHAGLWLGYMPTRNESSLHPFLVDLGYWRSRLGEMANVPQRLLIYPRPDLSEPGVLLEEICVRAHDDESIPGLIARSVFRRSTQSVRIQPVATLDAGQIDWESVRSGAGQVLVRIRPARHLRDRVLDLLRTAFAVASIRDVDPRGISIQVPAGMPAPDHVLIARHLLDETPLA